MGTLLSICGPLTTGTPLGLSGSTTSASQTPPPSLSSSAKSLKTQLRESSGESLKTSTLVALQDTSSQEAAALTILPAKLTSIQSIDGSQGSWRTCLIISMQTTSIKEDLNSIDRES